MRIASAESTALFRLIEHLADGFIYHVRRIKDKARTFAKDAAWQDWQQAAKNMDKAAQVLRLFIDDTIDEMAPFGEIKKKAAKLIPESALDSGFEVQRYEKLL